VKTAERQSRISAYLAERGYASLNELVDRFEVSISTVRRDLDEMQRKGVVKRTHGGAFHVEAREHPLDYSTRQSKFVREKAAIGSLAASLIQDGDAVLLDGGTTTFRVAEKLVGRRIQVVTNSLPVASLLGRHGDTEVILLGGTIIAGTGETLGRWADEMLRALHSRCAVIGIAGIVPDGLFNANLLMVELQRLMIEASDEVVVVVDSSKFGRRSLVRLCGLDQVDHLVTDSGLSEAWRLRMEQAGVRLHVADMSPDGKEGGAHDTDPRLGPQAQVMEAPR
jgi:DeoR family fructose operon transcriptional repressor